MRLIRDLMVFFFFFSHPGTGHSQWEDLARCQGTSCYEEMYLCRVPLQSAEESFWFNAHRQGIWSPKQVHLMHWSWDKMATILQMTFPSAFLWMKTFEFKWNFTEICYGVIIYTATLVQIMAWHRTGDKPLSEPMLECLYVSLGLNELTR